MSSREEGEAMLTEELLTDSPQYGSNPNFTLARVLFSCVRINKAAIPNDSFGDCGIRSRGCRARFHLALRGCLVGRSGGLGHSLDVHGGVCWCLFCLALALKALLRDPRQDMKLLALAPPSSASIFRGEGTA